MTLEEWKDLFKAAIAQRQWNVYSPSIIKSVLAVPENGEAQVALTKLLQVYETASITCSGERGLLAPMSPRWLVNKIKDIAIEGGTEPSMMQSEGSRVDEEQLLESQDAGAKTAGNTK